MSYRQDRKKTWIKLVGIVVIVVGAYFFFTTGAFTSASRIAYTIATPLWKGGDKVVSLWHTFVGYMTSKRSLEEENRRLRDELDRARARLLDRDLLYEENLELKKQLGRSFVRDRLIVGFVLAHPNRTPYDTLIIDIGENMGVAVGDSVFAEDNILIGEVAEVYGATAKVLLFSSPAEQHDVFVGMNGVEATAIGRGGGSFEIRLPRDIEVKKGDPVYLPGVDKKILGYVEAIDGKPGDPFKVLIVSGPINIFTIKEVYVAKTRR